MLISDGQIKADNSANQWDLDISAYLLSAAVLDNIRQTDRANPVSRSLRLIIHILNKKDFCNNYKSLHHQPR